MALKDFVEKKIVWMGIPTMVERFIFIKGVYCMWIPKRLLCLERTPSGKYSVNLFCKFVLHSPNKDNEFWKFVWMGLAPPKVEVFCWQLKINSLVEVC